MSNGDLLILIPLIPAAPVVITWWLPWERWLPEALPKLFLGFYILYATFAAWHFKLPWWSVLGLLLYSTVVMVECVREKKEQLRGEAHRGGVR
jgi:hypothetical protein